MVCSVHKNHKVILPNLVVFDCLVAGLGLARLSLDQRNPLDNDFIILLYIGPKRG